MAEFVYCCNPDRLLRLGRNDTARDAAIDFQVGFEDSKLRDLFVGLYSIHQTPYSFVSRAALRGVFSNEQIRNLTTQRKVPFSYSYRNKDYAPIYELEISADLIKANVRIMESNVVARNTVHREDGIPHCSSILELELYVIDDDMMPRNVFLGRDFMNLFFSDDRINFQMTLVAGVCEG